MPCVLAAPDKFRGTASAPEVAAAVARAARGAGWSCEEAPVADGGEGLLEVMGGSARVSVVKGPLGAQVALLRRRLERLAQVYEDEFGVDVRAIPGSGAAGGLAGGLAALGATLTPGFDVVAETIELAERMEKVDLVVAGEGFLDEQS